MTVNECEKRNRSTLLFAIAWANKEELGELTSFGAYLMCECLNIKCPSYMAQFKYSESPNTFAAYGSFKRIGKFLHKLALQIIENETHLKEKCFIVQEF